MMTKVCICGGGALGHVCAAVLASHDDVEVNVLTQRPECWSDTIVATDNDGKAYTGHLNVVSSDPSAATDGCSMVFLCLPGYAIETTLEKIRPYLSGKVVGSVVCSTGFFFAAHKVLGTDAALFGFQRVPYIARTTCYGVSARLLGYKSKLFIATENINDTDGFVSLVEKLWMTPVCLLNSYFDVSLTNSNPILHTGRLYSMWHDWDGAACDHNILFYHEWTLEASRLLLEMDAEFMKLVAVLPVTKGAIPSLLEYYECHDAESLTAKIRSIEAFKVITSPMKQVGDGWIPDFGSRYFTEDFPYGLRFIVELCHEHGVQAPTLNRVYEWGISKIAERNG